MQRIGRNDPCPCGSNKKYKKCCGVPKKPKILGASVVSSSNNGSKVFSLFQNNVSTKQSQDAPSSIADKVSKPSSALLPK